MPTPSDDPLGSAPPNDEAPPRAAAPRVDAPPHRACRRCGYDVTRVADDSACAECGLPIHGPFLADGEHRLVLQYHRGATLVVVGYVTAFVTSIVFSVLSLLATGSMIPSGTAHGTLAQVVSSVLGGVASLAAMIGWWWFSRADPQRPRRAAGFDAGSVLRVTIPVTAFLWVVSTIIGWTSGVNQSLSAGQFQFNSSMFAILALGVVMYGASALMLYAGVRQAGEIADGIPDSALARSAPRRAIVITVLFTVGIICLGLGPLVAQIMTILVLLRVRRGLGRILAPTAPIPKPASTRDILPG